MDKKLKLLYFVLLAGDCKINLVNNLYSMEYKIVSRDRMTCGRIKFDLQDKFKITEGLGSLFLSIFASR